MEHNIHACSNGLRSWSSTCLILGCILIPLSILLMIVEEKGSGAILTAGLVALMYRPLLKGLSLIVRNSETQLAKENDLE